MGRVNCASIDCEYNHNNKCTAKEIQLNDGHIHTVHQGFKHIHECKTYKKSQYYEEVKQNAINKWNTCVPKERGLKNE